MDTICCDHTPSAPYFINFFKPFSLLAGESSSGSDRGIAHFLMATNNTIKGMEERTKNKRTIWTWVNSSARRLSCDTLHSLCICRLSLTCSFAKFPQDTKNADSSWLVFHHCYWTLSHADWSLLCPESTANCPSPSPVTNWLLWVPLSKSSLSRSLTHFRHVEDRELKPLFGFAPKQTKGSSVILWGELTCWLSSTLQAVVYFLYAAGKC